MQAPFTILIKSKIARSGFEKLQAFTRDVGERTFNLYKRENATCCLIENGVLIAQNGDW